MAKIKGSKLHYTPPGMPGPNKPPAKPKLRDYDTVPKTYKQSKEDPPPPQRGIPNAGRKRRTVRMPWYSDPHGTKQA